MRTLLTKSNISLKPTTFIKPKERFIDFHEETDDFYTESLNDDWPFDQIVTEDDTPVDNIPSAKQQRLLVDCLYNSWTHKDSSTFLADANIGLFYDKGTPAIVPDMLLSLGVQVAKNWWEKKNRSYFVSVLGKPPDVVIEIVSNTEGKEDGSKLDIYATVKVPYYVIFDPGEQLKDGKLRIYQLKGSKYVKITNHFLPKIGLSLTLWTGVYEKQEQTWLRWCDQSGQILLTGGERAEKEHQRAEEERQRAEKERLDKEHILSQLEQERLEKEQALAQVNQLMAKLQALGASPNELDK